MGSTGTFLRIQSVTMRGPATTIEAANAVLTPIDSDRERRSARLTQSVSFRAQASEYAGQMGVSMTKIIFTPTPRPLS
jgi:hypothetical protein